MTRQEWFDLLPGDVICLARTGGREMEDGTRATIVDSPTDYYDLILSETEEALSKQYKSKGWALQTVYKSNLKPYGDSPGWAYEYWLYDIIWTAKPEEIKSRIGNIE